MEPRTGDIIAIDRVSSAGLNSIVYRVLATKLLCNMQSE